MSSETWKKRLPVSVSVVCGRISVLSIGPPFQVDCASILTFTPCASSVTAAAHASPDVSLRASVDGAWVDTLTCGVHVLAPQLEPVRGDLALGSAESAVCGH